MIQTSFLTLCLLIVCSACKGQHTKQENDYSSMTQTNKFVGDTVSSLSKNIMVVFQDSKSVFWFGSWVDGLYRYDGKTLLHITKLNGISFKRVDEIKEDSYGNLFVNTHNGIFKLQNQSSILLKESSLNDTIWHRNANDVFFKNTQGSGHIYRFDGKFLHSLKFPPVTINGKVLQSSFTNKSNIVDPYGVYTIYTDSKGNQWFGMAAAGVCYFDGKTLRWIHEDDVTELHNGPANGVRSILEDKEEFFWFNTLYRYHINDSNTTSSKNWYTKTKSIGSLDGKKNGEIVEYLSLTNDSNNVIWILTYVTGIWEVNGKSIKNHLIKDSNGTTIHLYSIYKDTNGKLWVGTHENGVYTYNGNTFEPFIP